MSMGKVPGIPEMPPRGEVSDEAVQDLIAISLDIAREKIEDWKQSQAPDLWPLLEEQVMEEHEQRAARIRLWAFQKRTGYPF